MKSKNLTCNIPELRFPEFRNKPEWEEKKFSNYIKLYRGSSPRPIQDYLTQDDSGVNWIKIGDTKNAINSILYKVEEKITPEGAKKSRKVEIGELILANSMSFGKTYELQLKGCIYDGWFVLREYEKYFYKPFLLQLLNSEYMQQQYKKLSAGGIVQNISGDIVNKTMIFHTSILEQQKIADCLSSIDNLITVQSKKEEILKEHKKALMQQLFPENGEEVPKLRFPEFKNAPKWEDKTLGDVGKVSMCKRIMKDETTETGVIPFYKIGTFGKKADAYIAIELYEDYRKKYSFPKKGDILISASGTIGRLVVYDGLPAYFQDSNIVWIDNNEELVINSFLLFFYESVKWTTSDTTIARLYNDNLRSVQILKPSIKEQQKIADCLNSINELIISSAKKVEALKEHKKGLMQQLFPSPKES